MSFPPINEPAERAQDLRDGIVDTKHGQVFEADGRSAKIQDVWVDEATGAIVVSDYRPRGCVALEVHLRVLDHRADPTARAAAIVATAPPKAKASAPAVKASVKSEPRGLRSDRRLSFGPRPGNPTRQPIRAKGKTQAKRDREAARRAEAARIAQAEAERKAKADAAKAAAEAKATADAEARAAGHLTVDEQAEFDRLLAADAAFEEAFAALEAEEANTVAIAVAA